LIVERAEPRPKLHEPGARCQNRAMRRDVVGRNEPMSSSTVRIAAAFVEAHRRCRRFSSRSEPELTNFADVYRVQDEVLATLSDGGRASAWKVSPPRAGAEPTAAPIPPARVHASPARLLASDFHMLGVEVEIALRFGRDLPPRAGVYADEEVFDAVEAAVVVIELCDTRLADWAEASLLWRLADFQSNGALVVGSGVADWRRIDFGALLALLRINGALIAEARGSHPAVDPSRLLPWIAGHVAQRCGPLRAGDVVTTGTWTGMHFAAAGDVVEAEFPGVGEARLTFAV
jgi:2-keto-4-pentenoate hydratase